MSILRLSVGGKSDSKKSRGFFFTLSPNREPVHRLTKGARDWGQGGGGGREGRVIWFHGIRNGPLENLSGGGAGEVHKKNSRKGKLIEKNILARQLILKKYSCYSLKKIHTRNLMTKKNSCGSKIPLPPPHNFSNGPSLSIGLKLVNFTLSPKQRDCSQAGEGRGGVIWFHVISRGLPQSHVMRKSVVPW